MAKIVIQPGLSIDQSEIEERFVLSSGPGGQNVNKVASAVELRFDVTFPLAKRRDSRPPQDACRASHDEGWGAGAARAAVS